MAAGTVSRYKTGLRLAKHPNRIYNPGNCNRFVKTSDKHLFRQCVWTIEKTQQKPRFRANGAAGMLDPRAPFRSGEPPINNACPAGDLQVPGTIEALLATRASPQRDIIISILGWTHGSTAVTMREAGVAHAKALASSLERLSLPYLFITTQVPSYPSTQQYHNLCRSRLLPMGLCCGWSSVGMIEVHNRTRAHLFPTHPYMLFLQRWAFTSRALSLGYSVLSLDSDIHLASNPLELLQSPTYRQLHVSFQARKPGHPFVTIWGGHGREW